MLQPHSLTVVKFHGEGAGRDATRWERGAGLQRAAQPGTSTAGSTEHSDPRQLQEGGGRGELQQHSVMTRSTMRPAVPLTAPNRALCMSVQEVFDYNSIHLLCCLLDHGGRMAPCSSVGPGVGRFTPVLYLWKPGGAHSGQRSWLAAWRWHAAAMTLAR